MQPKNIVEAYKIAVLSAAFTPQDKIKVFEEVICFCENDKQCSRENSIKRNTLLFWAYNHLAKEYERRKNYNQAIFLWQKAYPLVESAEAKIRLGLKMLDVLNVGNFNLRDRAKNISELATILIQGYEQKGLEQEASNIKRLKKAADCIINGSRKNF